MQPAKNRQAPVAADTWKEFGKGVAILWSNEFRLCPWLVVMFRKVEYVENRATEGERKAKKYENGRADLGAVEGD